MKKNDLSKHTVTILIITDRLPEYATSLYNFFTGCANIHCSLIHSANEFHPAKTGTPDFLLVAGYLENTENYALIEQVRAQNKEVYCLLLGSIDSYITLHSSSYHFNDHFDRRLPHSSLLEHIMDLQEKRIKGFAYNKLNNTARLVFRKKTYDISAYDQEYLIDIAQWGIRPAGPSAAYPPSISYSDKYCFRNGVLTLSSLKLHEKYGIFPDIHTVPPVYAADEYLYRALNIPVLYTGTLLIKSGRRKTGAHEYNMLHELFGCRRLIQLTLVKGRITSCKNMSWICRKIQWLNVFLPILKRKKNITPLQKAFLEDRCQSLVIEKQLRYQLYQKYFAY